MEEILASIRRIIADDQSRARLNSGKLVSVPTHSPGEKPAAAEAPQESEAKTVLVEDGSLEATGELPADAGIVSFTERDHSALESARAEEIAEAQPGASEAANEEPLALPDRSIEPLTSEPLDPARPQPPPVSEGMAGGQTDAPGRAEKLEAEVAQLVQDSFADHGYAQENQAPAVPETALQESDPWRPSALEAAADAAVPCRGMPEPGASRSAGLSSQSDLRRPGTVAASTPQPRGQVHDLREMGIAEPRGAGGEGTRPEARGHEPGPILSSETDLAVARAFNSLSRTVLSDNARTLEDLVTEMLRPLLKAWLDDNLPPLVERLVRMEIERVARGRPG